MDPATLVKLVAVGGIVLIVVAIGLRARPADTLYLIHNPSLGLRAMVAMFVAVPAFVLFVTWAFPLDPAVRAALLALAVSPMPPILPNKEAKVGGNADYAIGLQVLATVVSILVVPLMLFLVERIFGVSGNFDPIAIAKLLIITVGAPLAVGMALGHFLHDQRDRLAGHAARLGAILLATGVVFILIAAWPAMGALIGGGALAVAAATIIFALAAGHLLGGPDEGNRGALAVACAARHPGVAIALSVGVFPAQQPAILGFVLLYLLCNAVLTIPYVKWRKQHAKASQSAS